jgi:UDP-glucuronate 4-epimerase
MAYWSFTRAILDGEAIPVFNHGRMQRDFTYVDDVVAGVLAVLDQPPAGPAPQRVLNIGGSQPVPLLDFIGQLESALGVPARLEMRPMQPGDVPATCADVSRLNALPGAPQHFTPLATGLRRFVQWYREYHRGEAAAAALTPALSQGEREECQAQSCNDGRKVLSAGVRSRLRVDDRGAGA